MKKITCVVIALLICFSVFCPFISAVALGNESVEATDSMVSEGNTEASESDLEDEDISVDANEESTEKQQEFNKDKDLLFSCEYDPTTKKVNISGTMSHSASLRYQSASMEIYAFAPGADIGDIETVATPIAQASPSIKFGEYSFDATTHSKRYSRYVIALRGDDGELLGKTDAKYAEIKPSALDISGKQYFKGISADISGASAQLDMDSSVIPIYLEELFQNSYRGSSEELMLDKSYITELDTKVNSAAYSCSSHRGVYLKFVWSSEEGEIIPDIYKSEVLAFIGELTSYLANRYNAEKKGKLLGIILGEQLDYAARYSTQQELNEYAELITAYAATVASASRVYDPSIKVILPFSSDNFAFKVSDAEDAAINTKDLLKAVFGAFDDGFVYGNDFTLLIRSNRIPFSQYINDPENENGMTEQCDGDCLCARCFNRFTNFLTECKKEFSSVSKDVVFLWDVPQGLSGDAVRAAYSYSYYRMLAVSNVTSFILSLPKGESGQEYFNDLFQLVKNIDTLKALSVTKSSLEFFGKSSWSELDGIKATESMKQTKLLYILNVQNKIPSSVKGSFKFLDFPSSVIDKAWMNGVGCTSMKAEYVDKDKKALQAMLSTSDHKYGEVIYELAYDKSFLYTPFVEFELKVENRGEFKASDALLYEVNVIFESSGLRLETSSAVREGDMTRIIVDLSDCGELTSFDNLRISVRSLNEEDTNSTLWLYGVTGYSDSKTDEELTELISNSIEDKNNTYSGTEQGLTMRNLLIAIGIVVISAVLGPIIFLNIKRDDKTKNKE